MADLKMAPGLCLKSYAFRWEGLEDFGYPKDPNGVPLVNMGKAGLRYNPVTTAQYGLFRLQIYAHEQNETVLNDAAACVRWLLNNFQKWKAEVGIGGWVYDYDMLFYGPKAPWISGMAQGQAISLLLRFNQIEPLPGVETVTRQAFCAFQHPVADGGVVARFPDGSPIFEEFPTEEPSRVLNGHIFALLGIHDFATVWRDRTALGLFQTAVAGLKQNLQRYDTGTWNLYDLHASGRLASPMYVRVHVQLLNILAELTGDEYFHTTAVRWAAYLKNPLCRARWLIAKIVEKGHLT